jgi:uncharacterized protein with ParB-like and HNH nuclease domain
MDARAKTVREILHSGDQYLVPFFQRSYSWTGKYWERLFSDVLALMQDERNRQHFLGPLVCTATAHQPGEVPGYLLIDGQQRLTTLTLLLAALRDVARTRGLDDLADEIMEDYLVHKRKKGFQKYKVVPRLGDREALAAVVEDEDRQKHARSGIAKAYRYFCSEIEPWGDADGATHLERLFKAVTQRLSLVVVTIDGENPYEIFESLNSTGLPLEESDLIRNYLFMLVPLADQAEFNEKHWQPFEGFFEAAEGRTAIPATAFYRNYVMREGAYSKAGSTFVDFKDQFTRRGLKPEEQVKELSQFVGYEAALRSPRLCPDAALRASLSRITQLDITTAYPLLLSLLNRHDRQEMDRDTLLGCLVDLESFVIRRSICGESTRAYGRWFPEAVRAVRENPREDLRQYWLRRGWPDDEAFAARLEDFPLYRRETKKARLLLEALEEGHRHKEKVDVATLTIEHVMPQTIKDDKAGKAWRNMLGAEWQRVQNALLHTIGNLTLSGYNPELSNRPFEKKQRDYGESNVVLNRYFAKVEVWNEDAIRKRSRVLAEKVLKLWPRPDAGPEYILPDEEKDGDVDTNGAEETRQFRLEYWDALNDVLAERNGFVKPHKPQAASWMTYALGRSGFLMSVAMHTRERWIKAQVECDGPVGRVAFKKLEADKDAIEKDAGEKLWWRYRPDRRTSQIVALLEHTNPLDEKDRTRQVEWLADQLETLYRVFSPRLKAMDLPKGKPEPSDGEA